MMKYQSCKRCFMGLSIGLCLVGVLLFGGCRSEDPATAGTPVDVSIDITLGGVRGYSSGLDDVPTIHTRATTPMATGTRFRVVALQRNRIAGQANYTATASGVAADGATMQLEPGKYKFVAYSFNTTAALPTLSDEGVVPVTNATDFLFAQDVEEFREVGTDPVSLSFTFIPQRARVRVEMENFELGTSITSPGTVKLAGSFYTGASFSLVGGMLFGYTGATTTSYTFTFSDVAGVTRASDAVYVLPTSGTSTVSVAGATVPDYVPYSGSGTLPAFLPGKEYVYMQKFVASISLSGANSFVVNQSGLYMIDASVKGNGKQVVLPAGMDASSVAENVPATLSEVNIVGAKSAKVLWETYNTTTAPTAGAVVSYVSYNSATKQISFTATAKEGNAVIALYDGDNGTGNVLWSWHIWRTNFIPENTAVPLAGVTGFSNDGELVMMDRDLGALSAGQSDLSSGLMYQWGRKDPFMGPATITSSSGEFQVVGIKSSSATGSAALLPGEAVKNPTVQYKYYSSDSQDWGARNDNLWGTPVTSSAAHGANA